MGDLTCLSETVTTFKAAIKIRKRKRANMYRDEGNIFFNMFMIKNLPKVQLVLLVAVSSSVDKDDRRL